MFEAITSAGDNEFTADGRSSVTHSMVSDEFPQSNGILVPAYLLAERGLLAGQLLMRS